MIIIMHSITIVVIKQTITTTIKSNSDSNSNSNTLEGVNLGGLPRASRSLVLRCTLLSIQEGWGKS